MQVKGSAVQTLPLFIKSKFGEDALLKWKDSLMESTREEYRNILPSKWYPLKEILIDPTLKCMELFYNGKTEGAVDQGRFSAEESLKGIYKFFIKFGTPDFIIGKASSILPTYYHPSSMELVEKKEKQLLLRITKFDSPHQVIEFRIKGWIERALEMSGTKFPRVIIKTSMTNGAPYTDFIVSWS